MTKQEAGALRRSRRILFLVTVDQTALAFLDGQLSWLSSRGWDVHLGCSVEDPRTRSWAEQQGARLVDIPMQREPAVAEDARSVIHALGVIRSLRPNVVVFGTPKAGLVGSVAAFAMRVPRRIYVLHGLRLETTSGWYRRVLSSMEWLTSKLATDVVAVSPSLAARYVDLRLTDRDKVVVIGSGSANGVDSRAFDTISARESGQKWRGGLGEGLLFGFFGRLNADKGIDDLVRAFSSSVQTSLPNSKLVLIGREEGISELQEFTTDQLACNSRIVRLGHQVDIPGLMAAVDVVVLPTRREGLGQVSLEAAAARRPVVTTDATGAIDSVLPRRTGLIVPVGDVKALGQAMIELGSDPTLRASLGEGGRRWVETEFDQEGVWMGFEHIFAPPVRTSHARSPWRSVARRFRSRPAGERNAGESGDERDVLT
jgi:glycosyltransferase involved in cell wall biosynthesis